MIANQPVTARGRYHIKRDIEQAADAPGQEGLQQFIARRDSGKQGQGEARCQRRKDRAQRAKEYDMRDLGWRHGACENSENEGGRAEGDTDGQGPARQRAFVDDRSRYKNGKPAPSDERPDNWERKKFLDLTPGDAGEKNHDQDDEESTPHTSPSLFGQRSVHVR